MKRLLAVEYNIVTSRYVGFLSAEQFILVRIHILPCLKYEADFELGTNSIERRQLVG
jgi:hypothetical protein